MTEYVLGFMFGFYGGKKRVLLVEKSSPEWQRGKYNGVGGKIEQSESALDAMVREFSEETGINTSGDDWSERLTMQGADWQVKVFVAEGPIYIARQTSPKDRPIKVEIDALPSSIIPNLRWIVPFLCDAEEIKAHVYYPSLTKGVPSNGSEH
jgi:8-oxo-dGTP diphosphatase